MESSKEKPLNKEEIKEVTKHLRKIASNTNYYEYYSKQKISKKKIDDLLSLQQEPFYNDYLNTGENYIKNRKDLGEENKEIEDIYSVNKSIIDACEDERTVQRKIEKEIEKNEITTGNRLEYEVKRNLINKKIKEEMGLSELPCNNYEKLVQDTYTNFKERNIVMDKNIAKNPYDQQFDDKQHIRHLLDVEQSADHLCLVESDDIGQIIKQKVENHCNFQSPIENFIDEFKGKEKEREKQQKWFKEYVSNEASKGYYNMLTQMVDNDAVRIELKDGITDSLQFSTKMALSRYENLKEESKKLDAIIKTKESNKNKTHDVIREITKLDKQSNELRKEIRSLKQYTERYWNIEKNDFNHKNIDRDAEEETKNTISSFVSKNVEKMSSILKKREDCNQFDQTLNVSKGVIEGDITVNCKNDADEFRVNNQLVFVPQGERKAHYRFPTTFHDVKHKDKFTKMYSEQEMNTEFTKN